ncbi:MAG TPA: DUF4287 domain-containing protein [Candidatus Saccharibacteria bacterium]|nr:DUF4287 domain-containing protein [Candidatus Saccharibacteria bacterium]HMT55989.1 DUF4287 domain-containing protein [Candidatus Saccharibacteria bacterium]
MSFQAYIDAVVTKTGKQPEEIKESAQAAGIIQQDMKAREFCDWLATTYGLGHGHSMALWNLFIRNGWIVTKNSKIK